MLPVQLELKNFLAYRYPDPLLFEGIHLACLSGPNGAGKSSLLDAISWVLWGKARARSDDDLIHIGEDEMSVTLDFMQGGNRYRVLRARRRGKVRKDGRRSAGSTDLHLLAYDASRNIYNTISEGSIRETQQKIIDLLSLEYDTFVNSAFLQQGQADAFTVKTPAQRKQILGDILGLDRWSAYEEAAKEELRKIDNELQSIAMRLQEIDKEVAEEPGVKENLAVAIEDRDQLQETLNTAQERYDELAGVDKQLQAAEGELQNIERMIKQQERSINEAQAEIERNEQYLAECHTIIENRDSIQEGFKALQEAQEANQALGDALRELRDVETRVNDLEKAILRERQDLELQISQVQTRIEDAQQKVAHLDSLREQHAELKTDIQTLEDLELKRDDLREAISEIKQSIVGWDTENQALRHEMNNIRTRLDNIEEVDSAECPLCGQPLSEEHRAALIEELQVEGVSRGERYRSNQDQVRTAKETIVDHEETIKAYNDDLAQLTRLRAQIGSLDQQLTDAEAAAEHIAQQQGLLDDLKKTVAENQFALELHEQLDVARQHLDQITYDSDAHEAIRETLQTHGAYQQQANQLEVALQRLPEIEESLKNAQDRKARWQEMLIENQKRGEEIDATLEDLRVQVDEMKRRHEALLHQRSLHRSAEEKVFFFQQKLNSIENLRQRRETLEKRELSLLEDRSVYEQLKNAFSKNGIPAMIIDAAIPELEETANRLLRKMTSGRMNVRFDTQREKKTGGVAETFDIWISDELGTRDYSLYSGGEAFRVNFAIRVAISQLLARRAGAQLRTLFIDEGFGTQDEEGRQRLVEAINAVQDEFDLVLVITHIDELRDAFPVRIEIEKRPNGSQIALR